MLWVFGLALLIASDGWLFSGSLVPFAGTGEPEYLVLLPSVQILARWFLAALAALALLHYGIARRIVGGDSFRYLSPILMLALPLVAAALLATPLRRSAGPWLYVGIDLFPWLVLIVVVLIARELRAFVRWPSSRWVYDVTLAAVLVTVSLVASPRLRFQSVLVGDEPKYLRYLERWYRGHGMDVSNVGPIAELPPDAGPHVAGNFDGFARTLARVGKDLTNDARRMSGLAAPAAPGPARSQGGWFVDGKRGGVYQVHNPGISLLLFPGYLVDRARSHTQQWHPQFPTDLYATGSIVLLLYVAWGVSVFRLLRRSTDDAALSWVVAAVVF